MAIQETTDYIFFPKADVAEGKLAGMTNSQVCALGTKNYLFIIPKKSLSSFVVATKIKTYNYFGDGTPPEEGIAKMVAEPDMTVADLEERMLELLESEADKRIFKISEMKKFKNTTGIFGQTRFQGPTGPLRVLALRGRGVKKIMKEFYS